MDDSYRNVLSPRESAKFIATNSTDVKIKKDGVERVAKIIQENLCSSEYSIKAWKQHKLHPQKMEAPTVDWIFVIDTLNFSFWSESNEKRFLVEYNNEKHSGYWSLCAALKRALEEGIPITTPSYYSTVSLRQLQYIFRSATDTNIPLLEERLEHLHEVGKILVEKFDGSFVRCVEQCQNSVEKLLEIITTNFPCFRDYAGFKGKKVSILKRAQILVADIWACFEGKGYGKFHDVSLLTMFADYRVPQVLNYFGVLEYSTALMEDLKSFRLFTPGERLEVEIRGNSIWAVELIMEKLRQVQESSVLDGVHLNAVIVDFYLWNFSKDHWADMQHIPIHRIRSICY
ncbi:queuosine salvage protein-like [Anneissia japonica]|uniref:queuosine salvage protein-like n=1 Tax=Anneissia japonica TaxID=1529436 RepID=UPI0014256601|nr:queuosine salvage protein-like [Anneissia japonica]XP_033114698.1 queuosine salvage protein-like [Anneissia japonica]